MTLAPPRPELLSRALARALAPPVSVDGLRRMAGGASRETWAFDARDGSGAVHPLVLRRDPSAHAGQSARSTEYELLRAAARGGVPAPPVTTLLEPSDELGEGFVMGRVEGETIPRRILRDDSCAGARAVLARQCGEIAARIHALDPVTLPELPIAGAAAQLEQQRALLDAFGEPHAAFELGLRELAARVPAEASPRLVHGDFRNGNFVVGPDGIRAVLDWELAHLGDPCEDLGWLCVRSWRFGERDRVVGGFGDLDQLLDAYGASTGTRPDPEIVRFWAALGTLKWGVICIAQTFTHLHGIVRSVELAALGRRVAETEWDLLAMLDGGWG